MKEAVIEHYGVKGMKWGVITQKLGRKRGPSAVAKEAASLSDAELQKKVNRLNMEKQYVSLTNSKNKREQSSISKGQDYVAGLVAENADRAVRRAAKNVVNMAVDKYTT
jgi:hypothetical protein